MFSPKRVLVTLAIAGSLGGGLLGMPAIASAAPTVDHYPDNPKACVGYSSTSANAAFQSEDPDKYRSDQAHGLFGDGNEKGRKDDVNAIPQCQDIP